MDKFLLRPTKFFGDNQSEDISNERPRKVQFKNDSLSHHDRPNQTCAQTHDRSAFLRDWPQPPFISMTRSFNDFVDPFPLFHPSIARYFNQDDRPALHRHLTARSQPEKKDRGDGPKAGEGNEADHSATCENLQHEDHMRRSDMIDKRYVYSQKGLIKDFYAFFRPVALSEEAGGPEERDLPEEINRQILLAMAGSASADGSGKFVETVTPTGETDGWDEDEHSPVFWNQRIREVDFFVKNNSWSIDPIGDWSHLNRNKVPKDFLRKLRRYLEIRPLEYLNDTGSYRMFHVLNQYNDLRRIIDGTDSMMAKTVEGVKNWTIGCCGKMSAIDRAREMELDYLSMIWLSIWDPRLKANIFQLKEISMTDWFFSRVGWSRAVGLNELLTKNEIHSMDNWWAHRAAREQTEDDAEGDFEELEDWIAGEDDGDTESLQAPGPK